MTVQREPADLLGSVRAAVDRDRLAAHLDYFATIDRTSGTPGEREAVEYMARTLQGYGVSTEVREFEGYLSYPGEATLEILTPTPLTIPCRTRSFGQPTPPGGLELDLTFVDVARQLEQGAMIFSHRANAADYAGRDVRGAAVLTPDGGPDGLRRAQEQGAAAHIHLWTSDEPHIHEMIVTPIWGTPTPESAPSLPQIPALSVTNTAGLRLQARCAEGPVRARLIANVETGWQPQPVTLATIPGRTNQYLLVGAHIDSWYVGVTDNATGNAALLEMARVLYEQRDQLERGIVFAWWPGHSTGRYAGSTWYADTFFEELRANCVGYLNIDSPGIRGAEVWDCRYTMGEAEQFMEDLVREVTGQAANPRRPLKAGDQSFWGVGLTSLGAFRMLPVAHPDRKAVGGSGGGWWWHTPEDTLDKADVEVLRGDTELYAAIAARLAGDPILPYAFPVVARDFAARLTTLADETEGRFDFAPALAAANDFEAVATRLEAMRQLLAGASAAQRATCDAGLLRLCRRLNAALYTISGDYDQDPALQLPLLPGLSRAAGLLALESKGDAARFLMTRLVRERNRVVDALRAASDDAARLLHALEVTA